MRQGGEFYIENEGIRTAKNVYILILNADLTHTTDWQRRYKSNCNV